MSDLIRNVQQFGALIRRSRKARQWSQAELGERAGLRQATISLIERGNPALRMDTLLQLLSVLDLDCTVEARGKSDPFSIERLLS